MCPGGVAARNCVAAVRSEIRILSVDCEHIDSTRASAESDFWGETGEPHLAINSDAAIQHYFYFCKRPEPIEQFAIRTWSDWPSRNNTPQTIPSGRDAAAGV